MKYKIKVADGLISSILRSKCYYSYDVKVGDEIYENDYKILSSILNKSWLDAYVEPYEETIILKYINIGDVYYDSKKSIYYRVTFVKSETCGSESVFLAQLDNYGNLCDPCNRKRNYIIYKNETYSFKEWEQIVERKPALAKETFTTVFATRIDDSVWLRNNYKPIDKLERFYYVDVYDNIHSEIVGTKHHKKMIAENALIFNTTTGACEFREKMTNLYDDIRVNETPSKFNEDALDELKKKLSKM